jgi:hypothetical protein
MIIDTASEPDTNFLKNTAAKSAAKCSPFCDVPLICFVQPTTETQIRDYIQSLQKSVKKYNNSSLCFSAGGSLSAPKF